jgi:hypothetical protein
MRLLKLQVLGALVFLIGLPLSESRGERSLPFPL